MRSDFDGMLKKVGIEGIRCAIASPNMNAVTESFNATFRREFLDYFICFSLDQINRITDCFARFYNYARPHQGKGIGNKVLDKTFKPKATGKVKCESKLAGLFKNYYRDTG